MVLVVRRQSYVFLTLLEFSFKFTFRFLVMTIKGDHMTILEQQILVELQVNSLLHYKSLLTCTVCYNFN